MPYMLYKLFIAIQVVHGELLTRIKTLIFRMDVSRPHVRMEVHVFLFISLEPTNVNVLRVSWSKKVGTFVKK